MPTLTVAAKNLATEMTNYNVEENNLYGEAKITDEHIQNNANIRKILKERGIKPEELPPSEDIIYKEDIRDKLKNFDYGC